MSETESVEITPELILNAYAVGFFPMAESREDKEIFWVDPDFRGIIPLEKFHISKSLKRFLKKAPFTITCNTDFDSVINACAAETKGRPKTWINQMIVDLYTQLHHMGYAHSVEVWEGKKLVGGIYGVSLKGAFFGESMFSRTTNASKVALVSLVARLKYAGFTVLDTQFVTDHLRTFGAVEISKEEYKRRLSKAITQETVFYSDPDPDGWLIQSITQIS